VSHDDERDHAEEAANRADMIAEGLAELLADNDDSNSGPGGPLFGDLPAYCGHCIGCASGRPYDCDRFPTHDDPRFVRGTD
jgi:hypothetical protein